MECSIRKEGNSSIISLAGEIDLHCSSDARKAILSELGQERSVMVDMSDVKYIDSSAIASLVEGFQMAKHSNLDFALVNISNEAMQVLKLARLDKVFTIFDSIEEAING